jgi:hypothetical protein
MGATHVQPAKLVVKKVARLSHLSTASHAMQAGGPAQVQEVGVTACLAPLDNTNHWKASLGAYCVLHHQWASAALVVNLKPTSSVLVKFGYQHAHLGGSNGRMGAVRTVQLASILRF